MARPEKVQKVTELIEKINKAKSLLLTDFTGLNVEEISDLRGQLRQFSVEYKIVKNTLAKLAVEQAGLKHIVDQLEGPTAIAFGMDDPIAPAKVISEFSKKFNKPAMKAYILEGDVYKDREIAELAKLPDKDILLTQLVWTISAPLTNLASLLQNLLQQFVVVLNEIKDKKEQ